MDAESLLLRLKSLRSISCRSEGVLGPGMGQGALGGRAREQRPVTFSTSLSSIPWPQGPAFCYQIHKATMCIRGRRQAVLVLTVW